MEKFLITKSYHLQKDLKDLCNGVTFNKSLKGHEIDRKNLERLKYFAGGNIRLGKNFSECEIFLFDGNRLVPVNKSDIIANKH